MQTLAFTSDQHNSQFGGAMTGIGSVHLYNGQKRNRENTNQTAENVFNSSSAYHQRKNIDRNALLEEIEKNKIEEIKIKTFKNVDKFGKVQTR